MVDEKTDDKSQESSIIIEDEAGKSPDTKITLNEAQEQGLDEKEIELGKKHGLFVEEKKADAKKEEKVDAAQDEKKETEKKEDQKNIKPSEKRPWDLTKDEREEMKDRSPNEIALYVKSKRDKHKRQEAEAELAQLRAQTSYYKGKAEALEKVSTQPPVEQKKTETDDFLDDYAGKKTDKEKPLTESDLVAREKAKEEKERKQTEEFENKRRETISKLDAQEKSFTEDNPDYTDVYDKFTVGIIKADDKKLTELFPKRHEREGVKAMVAKMMQRLTEPDKYVGDESPAALAYEIGKLHPEYGQSTSVEADEDEDIDEQGDKGSDEKKTTLEKRLDKQGRPSSAPLSGGSNRRPISVKDLTGADLAVMPEKQFKLLYKNHRKEVDRILAES